MAAPLLLGSAAASACVVLVAWLGTSLGVPLLLATAVLLACALWVLGRHFRVWPSRLTQRTFQRKRSSSFSPLNKARGLRSLSRAPSGLQTHLNDALSLSLGDVAQHRLGKQLSVHSHLGPGAECAPMSPERSSETACDLKDAASSLLARQRFANVEQAPDATLRRCLSEGDAETVQQVADAQLGVPLMALPSDSSPWERVHIWLVSAEGLPSRPSLWPFEPYVIASAEGCNTGSSSDCPIGAY